MIAFFVFIAALFGLAVLAVTLPFWYERGNSPSEDIPSAPYGPRPVFKLWFEACIAATKLGLAFPLDPILRHIEKADKHEDTADLPPLLLVHGLYHNPSGWMFLRRSLRKAGFRKIHTVAYSSWNTSIEGVTGILESAVRDLESIYPGRKPILIGHSLGGLIIRNWLAKKENQDRAQAAVTLGTPHRGSKMAAIAFGNLGRSLCPQNLFFEELARSESAATIPCISLVAEADTMVLPQQNLVPLTDGWLMRLTPYATHAGLLTKGSVCRMVAWELHKIATHASETNVSTAAIYPLESSMSQLVAGEGVGDDHEELPSAPSVPIAAQPHQIASTSEEMVVANIQPESESASGSTTPTEIEPAPAAAKMKDETAESSEVAPTTVPAKTAKSTRKSSKTSSKPAGKQGKKK